MVLSAVTFSHRASGVDPVVTVAHLGDRATLASRLGVDPETTDRVLVSAAHRAWGREAADRLTGAFAFVRRVPGSDTVRLARDATGQVPLFYAITGTGVVTGTDLAAIAADPAVPDDIDLEALAYLYAHAHRPWLRRTGLRAVAKVPPGHVVEVTHGRVREFRYWRPERIRTDRRTPADRQLETIDQTLQQVVAECVAGHDRVGAHLSGGLDSAVITAVAQRTPPGVLQAYSWSPPFDDVPHAPDDERDRVNALAQEWGLPVHFSGRAVSADEPRGDWDPVLRPRLALGSEAAVLADAAQRGITLLLSGWGGDEGLSAQRPPRRWSWVRRQGRRWLTGVDPSTGALLAAQWRDDWPQVAHEVQRSFRDLQRPGSLRQRQVAWLANGHLAGRNESWFAAAAPLGIRHAYPLQDRRLLELALAAPPELAVAPDWSRMLMRRIAARHLPEPWAWSGRFKAAPAQQFSSAKQLQGDAAVVADLLDIRERAARRARNRVP